MRKKSSSWKRWAGVLLLIGNVMVWEGMYLSHRWRGKGAALPQQLSAQEKFSDTICPEQTPCTSSASEKARLEKDLAAAREHQKAAERLLAQRDRDLASVKSAARERPHVQLANPETVEKAVLIATPVKNSADKVSTYFQNLATLTYPKDMISLGFMISDSLDLSAKIVRENVGKVRGQYRRATVIARDFGYQQAPDPDAKSNAEDEVYRRAVLARSRNYLLAEALHDEGWVLWLDVDIVKYPPGLIETLLAPGADIVTTSCIFVDDGGQPTDQGCEEGSWTETDASRAYLKTVAPDKPLFESFGGDAAFHGSRLRLGNETNKGKKTVPLDAVGAATTLVRADLHRDGLVFPPVLFDHQIEAEAFGKMAVAAGYTPIGLPGVVVHHAAVHLKPQPKWD